MNIPVHNTPSKIEIVDIYQEPDTDEQAQMREELEATLAKLNAVESQPDPNYERWIHRVEQLQDHASYLEMRLAESL